jgi:DNA-binding CsgD family transcriptional regulator
MSIKNLHKLLFVTHHTFFSLLLITLPALLAAQSMPGAYPIQNFTPSDYKAGIQNIDFAQNRDMRIFVANNLCVLGFNGTEWGRYNYKSGKKHRSLAFDEDTDRLYVGAQGEFGYFEQDWAYVSLSDQLPEDEQEFDEVWDVYLLGQQVYFCTFQGIYVYDGSTIETIRQEQNLERTFLVNSELYVQAQSGILYEVNGNKLTPALGGKPLTGILAGMITYEQGLLLFFNSGEVIYHTALESSPKFPALIEGLKGTYVNHVLQLSDRRLAIATQAAGLFLFDPQSRTTERITTKNGLASNACLRSFQDYQGNLWIGMQNGIALLHINSPMRLLGKGMNLQGSGYEGFTTGEGTYFTTSSGIFFLPGGGNQCTFLPGTEGPAYDIERIGGRLYAGHHRGLFLLENGQARQVAETDGLWTVKTLNAHPGYAIGGTYFGLYLFKFNTAQILSPLHPISGFDLSSRFFEEDATGKIWVSQYYKGLYRLNLSEDLKSVSSTVITSPSTPLANEQASLVRVEDQLLLASSAGLYRLNPENEEIDEAPLFTPNSEDQPIYLVAQDRKNNIHVLSDTDAGFYDKISQDNYRYHSSSLYQLRYHLNNDLLQASVDIDDGVLFSANEGFVHYMPEEEDQPQLVQPLIIRQVTNASNHQELYALSPFSEAPGNPASIEISQGAKVLKFSIEGFQFSNLNDTQYRFFLKGFDEQYSPWSSLTSKEYTNLKAGTYEFTAQARSYLGQTTTSTPIVVTVTPPFYKSSIAKLLYALLIIGLIIALSLIQRRRYQLKARQLEQQQQLKLQKEQQKLSLAEEEKKETLNRLKRERVETELRHVNNLLAASTMNLVVKNEFIDSIKQELQSLKENGRWAEAKQALERIVREIDTNLKLQEDWEQFEYHFDKVHGSFQTRLQRDYPDLSPNEQKLCTLLRLNLNTKEIANLLSISQRGVEVARYRLRRKLGLEKGQNLSKFILEY